MKAAKLFVIPAVVAAVGLVSCKENGDDTKKTNVDETAYEVNPTLWSAVDDLGREIDPDKYPSKRNGKEVGIFYFLWHGCHGYDKGANHEDVVLPSSSDINSPYNNQELWAANLSSPEFGPAGAMHHWSEPFFGYYLSNDTWVMRRHVQMLSAAGVDVLFLDVTNAFTYLNVVERLAGVIQSIRAVGGKQLKIAFIVYSSPQKTVQTLYDKFYSLGKYKDLWYTKEGKPLILAPEADLSDELKGFFTIRTTWFASHAVKNGAEALWFGDGDGKWTWGDYWPQQPGLKNGKAEEISIMPATHATYYLGRSNDGTTQPDADACDSGKGIYFAKQIERALEVDPDFVFITGWNEWTAQRQQAANLPVPECPNTYQKDGGWTYFVDQYTMEFSRDLEPMKGGFGDNYYYQMVDFIRQFKGVDGVNSCCTRHTMNPDGDLTKWNAVGAEYADYVGDTDRRNAVGWGRVGTYTNNTGLNDFKLAKVASDDDNLYFLMECSSRITTPDDYWMTLYISTGASDKTWEGFDYVVNRKAGKLEKCTGGWSWQEIGDANYKVTNNYIEIAIPLSDLGIVDARDFSIDFKWMDNTCLSGDIMDCMSDGDSAPDSRFRYRYRFSLPYLE